MSHFARIMLAASEKFASLRGCKRAIYLDNDTVYVTYEKPNTDEKAYDDDQYAWTNLFVHGYANPFKVDIHGDLTNSDDPKVDFITSNKYVQYMKQSAISDMFFSKPMKLDLLKWIGLASIGVNVIMSLVIIALIAG